MTSNRPISFQSEPVNKMTKGKFRNREMMKFTTRTVIPYYYRQYRKILESDTFHDRIKRRARRVRFNITTNDA